MPSHQALLTSETGVSGRLRPFWDAIVEGFGEPLSEKEFSDIVGHDESIEQCFGDFQGGESSIDGSEQIAQVTPGELSGSLGEYLSEQIFESNHEQTPPLVFQHSLDEAFDETAEPNYAPPGLEWSFMNGLYATDGAGPNISLDGNQAFGYAQSVPEWAFAPSSHVSDFGYGILSPGSHTPASEWPLPEWSFATKYQGMSGKDLAFQGDNYSQVSERPATEWSFAAGLRAGNAGDGFFPGDNVSQTSEQPLSEWGFATSSRLVNAHDGIGPGDSYSQTSEPPPSELGWASSSQSGSESSVQDAYSYAGSVRSKRSKPDHERRFVCPFNNSSCRGKRREGAHAFWAAKKYNLERHIKNCHGREWHVRTLKERKKLLADAEIQDPNP